MICRDLKNQISRPSKIAIDGAQGAFLLRIMVKRKLSSSTITHHIYIKIEVI